MENKNKNKNNFFKVLILVIFSVSFVFGISSDFTDTITDNLNLVWNPISQNGFELVNFFTDLDLVVYDNNGYFNDSVYYTTDEVLLASFNYKSDKTCTVNGNPILSINDYYEFDYRLTEGPNELIINCEDITKTKYLYYNPNLKVPIYDVWPEAVNVANFNVELKSFIDVEDSCILYYINNDGDEEFYSFTKDGGIYKSTKIFSIGNDKFEFKLNCSKEGYQDYLKGYSGEELGLEDDSEGDEWIVLFDESIELHHLNISSDITSYDLLDNNYESPYVGDSLIFSDKNITLNFSINESGKLKFKNLYYNPYEITNEFGNETVAYNFLIGKYFIGDNYVNNNQIEFTIEDIAGNGISKSYKIIYESPNTDIVVNDIDGNIYGDFIVVIENYQNIKENTFYIGSENIDTTNCEKINNNKDMICEISSTDINQDGLDENNEQNIIISVTLNDESSTIISKEYNWVKNIYNFEYDIIEYNKLSSQMPVFENELPIKVMFDKYEDLNFKIKIKDNLNNKEIIKEYSSNFLDFPTQQLKVISGILEEFNPGFNFITFTFLVDGFEKYKFEYVFYIRNSLKYDISKLNYRSLKDAFSSTNINSDFSICSNNICEFENCKDDCEKNITQHLEILRSEYTFDDPIHKITFEKEEKDYEILLKMFTSKELAMDEFLDMTFNDTIIYDNNVIFKNDEWYYYLSGNMIIKYHNIAFEENDFLETTVLIELLKKYKSESKIKYRNILETSEYIGTIDILPNKIKDCENIEKIDFFEFGKNIYCTIGLESSISYGNSVTGNFKEFDDNAIIINDNNVVYAVYDNLGKFMQEYHNSQININ